MQVINYFRTPDGRFSFDRAALLRVAKGLAYTVAAAALSFLIAHAADLNIGVSAQFITWALGGLLHLLVVYCAPTEEPVPTPAPAPSPAPTTMEVPE